MKTPIRTYLTHGMAAIMLLLPLVATAAPPNKVSVTAAYPSEAFQGEELVVVVSGSGFDAGSRVGYLVTGTTDASQVDVLAVQYISPSELRTYIRPKTNALVTDYDIEVMTSSGRKGKGTTLFRVKLGGPPTKPPTEPPPTEPAARAWHSFTGNGSAAPDASRLYLFGGAGSDWMALGDLWSFTVPEAKWTIHAWGASTQPGNRQHAGFSCGGGSCVLANGSNGISTVKETWVFSEASGTWAPVNCGRRYTCPPASQMVTMAYDSARFYHLLFGGLSGSTALNDTYTFSTATGSWTQRKPSASPSPRNRSAATFVAGPVNRVVLLGGQNGSGSHTLCDMWSWSGSNWQQIEQTNQSEGPCLHSHSLAWDGARLVVTGGYIDTSDTPNDGVWTFTFTTNGLAGTWTWYPDRFAFFTECAGSPAIRPGAFMAYDRPTGAMVFFGGEENVAGIGTVRYNDLTACQ